MLILCHALTKVFVFLKGKNFEFEHETWHGECLIMILLGCKVK